MNTLHIGGIVTCNEPGCFKVFGTIRDWQIHYDAEHSDHTLLVDGTTICRECSQVFTNPLDWQDHWYDEHQPEDSIRESSDVCYAHGLIARGY